MRNLLFNYFVIFDKTKLAFLEINCPTWSSEWKGKAVPTLN